MKKFFSIFLPFLLVFAGVGLMLYQYYLGNQTSNNQIEKVVLSQEGLVPLDIWLNEQSAKLRQEKGIAKSEQASVFFLGNINLGGAVGLDMLKRANFQYPLLKIRDLFIGADAVVASLNSYFYPGLPGVNDFRADLSAVDSLQFGGINLVNLASDEVMEKGSLSLNKTAQILQTKQIDYCGAIENSVSDRFIIKEINSLKIAFLCYGSIDSSNLSTDKKSGLLPMDEQSLKSDLKKALQKASVAVVLFNNEADDEKGVSQSRAFSYAAIDYGASLVVGQSGAGRQSNELYKGKQVFLNLGNFLGGQQAGEDGYSLVLKVLLSKDGAQQFDYFVTKVVDWQVVLAAENESNEVLKNVIRK